MPSKGHHFYIRSFLNGLVLDVEGNNRDPGSKVVTWERKPVEDADNQLWYIDHYTSTIRTALNDFCLDMQDNRACINPYDEGSDTQKWVVDGQFIRTEGDFNKVMDIVGNEEDKGADICCWDKHGKVNQRWHIEHVPRRLFFIVSEKHDKVMDISGANADPGSDVIMWPRGDGANNQLWYFRRDGVIRSALNDFVLDSSDGDVKVQPFDFANKHQGFRFTAGTIRNLHNPEKCLDISRNDDDDGTTLCNYEFHGGDNQRWRLERFQ